jgi:hypothetical protein
MNSNIEIMGSDISVMRCMHMDNKGGLMQGSLNGTERSSLLVISPLLKDLARIHVDAVESETATIEDVDIPISRNLTCYLKNMIKGDYGFKKVELEIAGNTLEVTFIPKKKRKKAGK